MDLNWLALSYHSVGVFAANLISVILTIFLLSKKNKTPTTWWLAMMFLGYSFMLFGYVMAYSVNASWGAYHRFFTSCAMFGNAGMIGFAYTFPRLDQPKEAKIAIPLSFTLLLVTFTDFVYTGSRLEIIYNFTAHFYTFDYGAQHAIALLLTQIFPLTILIRKTIRYSAYDGFFSKWISKPVSPSGYPMFLLSRFCVGWIKFINPKGEDAKACKSFVKAIIIFLFIAALNVLNKSGIVTYDLYAFGFSNVTLVICFYFVITYLNNSPEPTTFMVKLVGVSLVTVLLVLGFVGNITLSLSEEEYDNQKRTEILGSKPFLLNKQYDQVAEDIEYIIRKPVDSDSFSKNLKIEYNRHPDQLNIERVLSEQKKVQDFALKELLTEILKKNGRSLKTNTPTQGEEDEALSRFSKTKAYGNLNSSSQNDLNRLYRTADKRYTHFDFIMKNVKYEVGFSYDEYRKHTHRNTIKLIYIIFSTSLLILIIFPRFFHSSLVKPLNDLLSGVTKVNEGNLEIQVPIKVQDEIGYLAGSFNSMVYSIKEARKELEDYAVNLEKKVKERTREVQEKMDEVQKLKIQQDGDYFLTSLLAKPLFFNANKSKLVPTEFVIHQKKKFEFKSKTADLGGDICITGTLKFGKPEDYKTYIMTLNGDAMGKSMQGAGGALVMGVVINAIMSRSASNKKVLDMKPEEWLTDIYYEVNSVFKSFNGTMVISATVLLIEEKSGEMFYFNAEHPATILYRDGKASFIEQELLLRKLGQESEFAFQVYKYQLEPGDIIILGSDGRDDINLTPNSKTRTINEDEFAILRTIEKTKGNIFKMEEALKEIGEITDDLSFLRVDFHRQEIREEIQNIQEEPISSKFEHEELEMRDDEDSLLDITEVYRQSKQLYQEGQVNEALAVLTKAHSVEPTNQKLNKLFGLMSFKGKDYATAVEVINHYLQMDPDTEEMWYYLSLSQKKMGRYLSSLEASKRVYQLHPDNINNLVNLSDLNRLTGNYDEAKVLSEKALELDPENQNARKILKYLEKA
ncbi:SpoIIE family protein phosphatase [Leptospira ilyithenensis]|uniref:HAMP domain-containing protein n=1 Tax=Leptospira ilyithenensis TaxID=2484901 RepID=A0A4R9LNG7_9LEPT|nr:SpoIIE family protein phosphatase [Leptospira ilyithenensis]TGN10244.1 HAMP domain-containing protein [Leptospira ilyithenensis]